MQAHGQLLWTTDASEREAEARLENWRRWSKPPAFWRSPGGGRGSDIVRGKDARPCGEGGRAVSRAPCCWAGFPCASSWSSRRGPAGRDSRLSVGPQGGGWAEDRNAVFTFRVCGRVAVAPQTRTLGFRCWPGQQTFGGGWQSPFSCFDILWARGVRPGAGPVKERWLGVTACLRVHQRNRPENRFCPSDFLTSLLLRIHLVFCDSQVPRNLCKTVFVYWIYFKRQKVVQHRKY